MLVIQKILLGLGFKETYSIIKQKLSLVDGECELNCQIIITNDVLLLDEPTNHLDIEIIWLESFLRNYPGVVVIVSR
jgi:ATP-binding cassette subfamily F protein 3